jgi:Ca-activated chloride channel family protein
VVLISDGGANTGITDEDLIGHYAANQEDSAIYLIGIGAADPEDYQAQLMDTVTDLWQGACFY